MGFGPTKFILTASLALLKTRAPGVPPRGLPTSLLPVANRVKEAANCNLLFSNIGAELINKVGFIPQEVTSPQFLTICEGQQPRGGM